MVSIREKLTNCCLGTFKFRRTSATFLTTISLSLMVAASPLANSMNAMAAERDSYSATLRRLTPAALAGNREAVRGAAKAIVKLGPYNFAGAGKMRHLLRTEALRGSSASAAAYGMMLQYGVGGSASPKEAVRWYSQGGALGNVSAAKNGAETFALGWGVRRDTSRALKLLASVPVDQRARTMLYISKALLEPGIEEPELSLAWLKRAVALYDNSPNSIIKISQRIARIDPESGDDMRVWLEPIATKGNGSAAMMLASYLEASGNSNNQAEILKLYLMAADKDIDGAYRALSNLLTYATPQTATATLAALDMDANKGKPLAARALADYYLFQSATSPEARVKGIHYLEQAANAGDHDAQYQLAITLLSEASSNEQQHEAKSYLSLAAKGGNRMADMALAKLGSLPSMKPQQSNDATR